MRPLRYSINVSLDGCYDHQAMGPDEELHRHAADTLEQADALLFGRVIYGLMEDAWRPVAETGVRPEWMAEWTLPFAQTIHAAKKYVVSSTLQRVDWNAELLHGDLGSEVQRLKQATDTMRHCWPVCCIGMSSSSSSRRRSPALAKAEGGAASSSERSWNRYSMPRTAAS